MPHHSSTYWGCVHVFTKLRDDVHEYGGHDENLALKMKNELN